ncbi:MAG: MmcQ/YjbR family DNA-binding protein [Cyclobacteriaceae bacterium]
MGIEEIREYCLLLPGTTEGMKWGEHLTFMVGTKMYAIFGLDQTPINASFKVSEQDFEEMSSWKGMKPAPYLARNKWIAIDDIGFFDEQKWKEILDKSYAIIKAKLPKKVQENLGL